MGTLPIARSDVLGTYLEVRHGLSRVEQALGPWSEPRLEELERSYLVAQSRLLDNYLEGLPIVPVSRCPFSGDLLQVPVDIGGLDGPWWDYQGPARPWWERQATLVAFTGALRLTLPVERSPWLICPGPEVPYLRVPVMANPDVRAVVSTVPVGAHTGYVVAYFAPAATSDVRPVNDWGAPDYRLPGPHGTSGWSSTLDDPTTFDVELEPWVASGRLLWIAPDDPAQVVRSGSEGCPYLSMAGSRQWQRIEDGEIW